MRRRQLLATTTYNTKKKRRPDEGKKENRRLLDGIENFPFELFSLNKIEKYSHLLCWPVREISKIARSIDIFFARECDRSDLNVP